MALLRFAGIGISGIAAAVPQTVYDNSAPNEFFSEKEAKAVINMTGIKERRIAGPNLCASDLSYVAAERLLNDMNIDRSTIDLLIFVSQTPDYRMPATAITLQHRLGLPQTTAAFDVNLGCSGFAYGLSVAYSFCQQESVRRVLLLNGETRTKAYSLKDKGTGLLFGDGGTATVIDRHNVYGNSSFTLNSSGKHAGYIKITSGGYRNMSSADSTREKAYEDGSIRTDEQGVMDGLGVFDFVVNNVPADISLVLRTADVEVGDVDFFLLHQANKLMTNQVVKKIGAEKSKVPYSLSRFGNTSSVSIPLTMVTEIAEPLRAGRNTLLLSGFGVGMSWASAVIHTDLLHVSELQEVDDEYLP